MLEMIILLHIIYLDRYIYTHSYYIKTCFIFRFDSSIYFPGCKRSYSPVDREEGILPGLGIIAGNRQNYAPSSIMG